MFIGLDRILEGEIRECESQDILDGAEDGGKEPDTGDEKDSTAGIAEGEWDQNNDRKDDETKPLGDTLQG